VFAERKRRKKEKKKREKEGERKRERERGREKEGERERDMFGWREMFDCFLLSKSHSLGNHSLFWPFPPSNFREEGEGRGEERPDWPLQELGTYFETLLIPLTNIQTKKQTYNQTTGQKQKRSKK